MTGAKWAVLAGGLLVIAWIQWWFFGPRARGGPRAGAKAREP